MTDLDVAAAPPSAAPYAPPAAASARAPRPRRAWPAAATGGWLVAAAGAASLVTACVVVSGRKWMWYDEVLTSLLVNDPSWRHMMSAITQGVEAAPPLYHFLARGWIALFGGTPLSLRLFTVLGLCAALFTLWGALARVFPWRAVAVGVLTVFCATDLVFAQVAEVRYYGVLTALVAAAVLLCHRVMTSDRAGWRLHAANGAVQALLVLAHVYGGLYSGGLFAALVAWDVARGVVRPRRWVAYPAGWLALLPWLGVYAAQRGAMQRSWIARPRFVDLTSAYRFQMYTEVVPLVLVAAVLLAAATAALRAQRAPAPGAPDAAAQARGRAAMLFVAGGLLTVPVTAFVVSRLVTPILFPRYLVAAAYAPGIIVAYLLTTVLERGGAAGVPAYARRVGRAVVGAGWGVVLALLLVWPLRQARWFPTSGRPGEAVERLRVDGRPVTSVPIAVENAFDLLPIMAYTRLPQSAYTFVLDSAVALAPDSHHREMLSYAVATLYRRVGYTNGRYVEVRAFLCARDRFLVFESPEANCYDRRVAADSAAFASEVVGYTDATPSTPGAVIRLVRRTAGARPAVCGPAGAPAAPR